MGNSNSLKRTVGVAGAVVIGLGSILGTGVFVVVGLGAVDAGYAIFGALAVAFIVACCNGFNSAQLAAAFPVAGGTYEYGYRLLKPELGFLAGWNFLLAKSASAATAAIAMGQFLGGDSYWARVSIALLILVALTFAVLNGLRRTNWLNIAIVSVTVIGLLVFSLKGIFRGGDGFLVLEPGQFSFFELCALIFVAYTGYGRIATMGEEIQSPRSAIPKAMALTLGASLLLYCLVALATLRGGEQGLLWRIAGFTAMAGVLLNLILGLSRMLLAMGRRGDLPRVFAELDSEQEPRLAVLGIAALIGGLILLGDIQTTWSFSAFTVLLYYSVTNLSALELSDADRLYPKALGYIGVIACLFLAVNVAWQAILAGVALSVVGLFVRRFFRSQGSRRARKA